MAKSQLKTFEELSHSNDLIRLDAFGGIQTNINEYDNPLIECFFTPLEKYFDGKESKFRPKVEKQFRAGFSVGYLPCLFVGQHFKHGNIVPLDEWPKSETIELEVDLSKEVVDEITLRSLYSDDRYLSKENQRGGNRSGLKYFKGKLLKTDHATKLINVDEFVVINELELIRYYLTNSSHSVKKIFNGSFTNNNLYRDVISNLYENEHLDPDTKAARLVYKLGYTSDDAPILARILFEQDNLGLKAAQRVHKTYVADKINKLYGGFGYPRTLFPFTGLTRLTLNGRRLNTDRGYVFLVYRIVACTAPFPFDSLSFCCEIEPGGESADKNAMEAFANQILLIGEAHGKDSLGFSRSDQAPKINSMSIQIALSERHYPSLANVEIKREKFANCTYKPSKKFKEFIDYLTDASTGKGTYGDSTAAKQSLKEPIEKDSLPADLSTFLGILQWLRIKHSDWTINTLTIGEGGDFEGEKYSEFPAVSCPIRKSIMRQFSYMDEAKAQKKKFVCAEILSKESYLYLFESERRKSKTNEKIYLDSLPILLVWSPSFHQRHPEDFLVMIESTVKNTTWPDSMDKLRRDFTVHGIGAETVENLGTRVEQLILRNL